MPGVCYPAFRYLPGRDSHPLETRSKKQLGHRSPLRHDATCARVYAGVGGQADGVRHYFRITFSDGVSASMNAGRLNHRSAYFASGAADFGSVMP